MSPSPAIKSAVSELRAILANVAKDSELQGIIEARDGVFARFQTIFSIDKVPELSEDDFKSFLNFKNNKHWTGLHRMGGVICSDMTRLREAMSILLDESRPIENRLDTLIPRKGPAFVPRLGKAVLTGILHVAHPDKYGVYNSTSEGGMNLLGVWPSIGRGVPFSERYLAMNEVLNQLAQELDVDLWTLDSLWWRTKKHDDNDGDDGDAEPKGDVEEIDDQRFGLERHLHNFMFDNWSKISLANEWDLHVEDGDVVGYEYNTNEIGRIDLLARHRTEPRWLVIELKRDQSSDNTVGQVTRYMGWVEENLAEKGDAVHGLIISRDADTKIRYALRYTRQVELMCYKVDFQLFPVSDRRGET